MPITGPFIQEKAVEYAQFLEHETFQTSSGWSDKFKNVTISQQKL